MNEKDLVQFIEWLPQNIEEFRDKTPENVVTILNQMQETDEGKQTIVDLINQYKESLKMFKKGGKIDQLLNKYQSGGRTTKINPNNQTAINKALNNRAGDRSTPHDTFTTTGLVIDSLIKAGYNPNLVRRLAKPILDSAKEQIIKEDWPAPEMETERQFNLNQYLHPNNIPYYKGGSKVDEDPIVHRDTTSVDRTVIPVPGGYVDRRVTIVETLPNREQIARTITRHINVNEENPNERDTAYYETINHLLHNGNLWRTQGPYVIKPDSNITKIFRVGGTISEDDRKWFKEKFNKLSALYKNGRSTNNK